MTTPHRHTPHRFLLGGIAAVLLSGCMLGPDFVQPAIPTAKSLAATPLAASTEPSSVRGGESQRFVEGGVVPTQWWKSFGSPVLDAWVDEALANSPTLASAEATLRQQAALLEAETGTLYPSVTANAGASRRKTSAAGFGGGGVRGSIFNLYEASVDVSYGLDLWGGTQRGIEGQLALVDAQRYQTSAAYLTLIGNVVTSAVSLASAQDRLERASAIIESYVDSVRLAQRQYELGAASRADVIAVESLLANAQTRLLPLQQELASARNRLAVLIGRAPSEFDGGRFRLADLTLPRELPVTLPSELVARRPDIAVATARLQAATADVGVASANLLPQLTISGSYGSQAGRPKQLFDDTIWSIAGNLSAPLFDGGSLRARKKAAVAAYEAAQASYRETVLKAFNEVADSLSALEVGARQLEAQQRAYTLAAEVYRITEAQYRIGAANIFEVRDKRLDAALAEQDLIRQQAIRFQDTAALYQALGGDGWNRNTPPPQTAAAARATTPTATP